MSEEEIGYSVPPEHEHGAKGKCARCGDDIEHIVYSAFNGAEYDVFDEWWVHVNLHPDNNHEAVLADG